MEQWEGATIRDVWKALLPRGGDGRRASVSRKPAIGNGTGARETDHDQRIAATKAIDLEFAETGRRPGMPPP